MDIRLKNILGGAAILALLVFSYGVAKFSIAYSKSVQPSSFKSFTVTGEGKITAVPDVAEFSFSVITEGGQNLDQLQQENSTKVNKSIDFLKAGKVTDKDIKTSSFNVEPRYQYSNCHSGSVCPPPSIVGYTVNQTVTVKARDFKTVGGLLAGVVKNGANSVSSLNFTLDDPDKVINEAKAQAIVKAKERAQVMAKAGGFHLGSLISIGEGGGIMPMSIGRAVTDSAMLGKGGAQAPVAPNIEPGSQEYSETVTLQYEIK